MNARQIAHTVRTLLARLDKHGAALDADTRAALDKGVAEANAVTTWRPAGGNIIEAAYAAVAEGKDPATDKRVMAAMLADRLEDTRGQIHAHAGWHLAATVGDHLAPIAAALDTAYQSRVAGPLAEAVTALEARGITHESDPALVVGSRDVALMQAWTTAQVAIDAHHDLLGAWRSLLGVVGAPGAEPTLLYVDPAGHTLAEVRALGSNPHPWPVLAAGMALSLTTPAKAGARQEQANAVAREQEAARGTFTDEYRRFAGVISG